MRKQRGGLTLWVIILGLAISTLVLNVSVGRAKEEPFDSVQGEATDSAMTLEAAAQSEGVEYYLPYPGVLPDHPLYWLKMVRDRVQLVLTTKPLPKAERLLLYADKRLGAGWALIEGGKADLGVTTITKAEKYLERALAETTSLGDGGDEVRFKKRLGQAALKHAEVIDKLKGRVDELDRAALDEMMRVPGAVTERLEAATMEKEKVEVTVRVEFSETEVVEGQVKAETALEALTSLADQEGFEVTTKIYDFGTLVEAINDVANSADKAWIYFVNDKAGEVGAGDYRLEAGDGVEWRYVEPV